MTIICQNCTTKLQIDDSKAPARPFTIRCPKCNGTVNSGVASPASEGGALAIGTSPSTEHPRYEKADAAPLFELSRAEVPDEAPAVSTEDIGRMLVSFFQKGEANHADPGARPLWDRRKALVCVSDKYRETVARLLAEETYKVFVAQDTRQAVERMRANQIEVLMLDPDFDLVEQGAAFVTREVQVLRPAQRRRLFVVSLSPSLRTLDAHAAFLNNVNAIVNTKELEHLPRILEQGLREYNELYRDFNQALGQSAI
jgi:predicted Zn finger-like uncharacterized protein